MFVGFRLWMSVTLMCIGSAILSWHQTIFFTNFQSGDDAIIIDEWVPMENDPELSQFIKENKIDDTSYDQPTQSKQHWNDNDRDGVGGMAPFREPKKGTIKSISLLGERNSGTRWIYG